MSNYKLLLVPGSFSLPEFYIDLLEAIRGKNLDIEALHLPSVGMTANKGREGPLPTMQDDATFIARAISDQADQGKDVIVICHSYGGIPATQSLRGLSKYQRSKNGKSGGVVRLAYMTSLVPPIGGSAQSLLSEVPEEYKIPLSIDESGWMSNDVPKKTAAVIAQNIPSEQGTNLVRRFPKHSSVSFVNELTYAGYDDVPVSYLLCEEDRCLNPDIQQAGIDLIEKTSEIKVDVTRIRADHAPNVSATSKVVDWMVNVVRKTNIEIK